MARATSSSSSDVELLDETYKEDQTYQYVNSEPFTRSENIAFHQDSLKWHVKVTFRGQNGIKTRKKRLARRKALEALISLIDFSPIPLLADTVTEIIMKQSWFPFSLLFERLPMESVGPWTVGTAITSLFWPVLDLQGPRR